jgi:hypothetical protein
MLHRTLAITWPLGDLSEEDNRTAAAQVDGGVSCLNEMTRS